MDKLELLNSNNLVYFSMWMTASKNQETNKVKKVPHFPKGYKTLTTSTIFEDWHTLLAIRTGIISNIFVIDIDDLENETSKKLNDICFKYCGWKVSTRKGYHYYFKYDERLNNYEQQSKASNVNNQLGFDTRGNGGIIFFGNYKYDGQIIKYDLLDEKPSLKIMTDEIFEYVKLLLDPSNKIEDGEVEVKKEKKVNIHIKYDGIINKIELDEMIKLIECIDDKRFESFETWRDLFFVCYNSNNDKKVINVLHKRSQIGKYKDIQLNECERQFYGNDYLPNFNIYTLKSYAREDNFNNKYNEYFNKEYDAYDFEYNNLDEIYLENDNKLNYDSISKYFKNEKLCVLKSPYGTGKTTYMTKLIQERYNDNELEELKKKKETKMNKDYIKEIEEKIKNYRNKRIIFLVMRQSLSNNLEVEYGKLGFKNYLDTNSKINHKDNRIIISLESLKKITYNKMGKTFIKSYDLVICDEFCSLLSHFNSPTVKEPESIFNLFELIIKLSTQTYFLDGDISNREVKYLQNYYDYTSKPLINKKVSRHLNMNLTYDDKKYFDAINEDLKNGKKICFVSMSSGFCETIKKMYGDKYKVLVYNEKTDGAVKKQLKDIETLFKSYDIVIYSPSITVGVSFDFDYFESIYGYICKSCCARVFYQMLFRIRKFVNNDINILIDPLVSYKDDPFIPFQEVKENVFKDPETLINSFQYVKLWNKWEDYNNINFLKVFEYYTNKKGFKFNLEKKPEKKIENQTSSKDNIIRILESKLIDYNEYQQLSKRVKSNDATTDEKYQIEKYIYFTKFKLDKDFKDEKVFKDNYYRKIHILKGYLYNKFNNNKKDTIDMLERILSNIKYDKYDDNGEIVKKLNDKDIQRNKKFEIYYEINKNIESLDEKYYNNKFDKKIIETKYKYFQQLQKILKVKDGKIDKDILTERKDDLINIFNDKEFKVIFETRTIKDATPKKLVGSINSVYNDYGLEVNNIRMGTSKNRTEHLEIDNMECIPKCYNDYEAYINRYINNDIDCMKYFQKLVKDKKDNKINNNANIKIEDFIIHF
jgi:hypothetical protein